MKKEEPAVLVIDDDQLIVDLSTDILSREGFPTFGTTDPEEAIRLVATNHDIKVVLSDLMMPKLTGPEVVRRALKSRDGDVRVLFMSGGFQEVRFRQTDRLLDKPLGLGSLASEVRSALTEPAESGLWKGTERRRQHLHKPDF